MNYPFIQKGKPRGSQTKERSQKNVERICLFLSSGKGPQIRKIYTRELQDNRTKGGHTVVYRRNTINNQESHIRPSFT